MSGVQDRRRGARAAVAPVAPVCWSVAALLCLTAGVAGAYTARLDMRVQQRIMTGTLDCTPGGAVTGEVTLDLPATEQTGPQLQAGGRAAGRYRLTLRLNGAADPKVLDAMQGTAELSGSFTSASGAAATIQGSGTFAGSGNEGLGFVKVEARWPQLACDGAGLTTPQELVLRLPTFAVDKTVTPSPGADDKGGGATGGADQKDDKTTPGEPDPPKGPTTPEPRGSLRDPPTVEAAGAPTIPPGTPLANAGLLETEVLKALVGESPEGDEHEIKPTATFPANCPLVYLYLEAKLAIPGSRVLVTLYHGAKIGQRQIIPMTAGDQFVVTFYPTAAEVFPAGQWSVVIKAGDQVLGAIPFSVAGPQP